MGLAWIGIHNTPDCLVSQHLLNQYANHKCMPTDSDETTNIDDLLAEIKNETVEESNIPKKEIKNPFKDKKNDESNNYEFSDDKTEADIDW